MKQSEGMVMYVVSTISSVGISFRAQCERLTLTSLSINRVCNRIPSGSCYQCRKDTI
jgi:hypothetical protein